MSGADLSPLRLSLSGNAVCAPGTINYVGQALALKLIYRMDGGSITEDDSRSPEKVRSYIGKPFK